MPSRRQVTWAELRVGVTVLVSSAVLAVAIFLVTGTTGLFGGTIRVKTYFDNAEGLRPGAPVSLQGVDIGNVTDIRIVEGRPQQPVEVTLKLSTRYRERLRKDSVASLNTRGALGETYIDIFSGEAKGAEAADGDVLPSEERPGLQDVVRASQTTLENMNVLLKRLDRIVAAVERGEGSVGKFIYDPTLFNKANETLNEVRNLVRGISRGEGTVGKLLKDEELYRRANASVEKLNRIVDKIERGEGSAGKFINDPRLYEQAEQTMAKASRVMSDVEAGKGTMGKILRDEEFAKKVDNTMTRLSQIADRLEAGEGTAGKLLRDPSIYTNADQMLVETRNLIKAVRENPKKYLTIRFKLF
ncbi:MAG TPA: MlaD family protein [Terriglobales bacterium]|nr:MlaD family protein [Terriglobales bacterium]